jgi:hypothetical protein
MLANGMDRMQQLAKAAGPYLLLEIFMPGGTLLALLLYWWKRRVLSAPALAARCSPAAPRT